MDGSVLEEKSSLKNYLYFFFSQLHTSELLFTLVWSESQLKTSKTNKKQQQQQQKYKTKKLGHLISLCYGAEGVMKYMLKNPQSCCWKNSFLSKSTN